MSTFTKFIFIVIIIAGLCFGQNGKPKICLEVSHGIPSNIINWSEAVKLWFTPRINDEANSIIKNPLISRVFYGYWETKGLEYMGTGLSPSNDTKTESKLSIGLKIGVGYNPIFKRVIRDSTEQLIIGLCLKRKITKLIDAEFIPSYQYFKSKSFGEGFTSAYYFDNLLMPIMLKFNLFRIGAVIVNWNIGTEMVFELDGNHELYLEKMIYKKGKIENLERLFYLHSGIGGNIFVSSRICFQVEFSFGYCLTPKKTYSVSNYPLRLCLGGMFLCK